MFGFFTRLPLGQASSLEELAAGFPLVPLVGLITGLLGGGLGVLLFYVVPPLAGAALLLAFLVGLTGLNQTDGLVDLGDGLMVHGAPERRREVMRDSAVGTGGLGLMLFTYLPAFAALAELLAAADVEDRVLWVLSGVALAEVAARVPYLLLSYFGEPSHPGLGSAFVAGFGLRHLAVGLVAASPALLAGLSVGWLPVLLAFTGVGLVAVFLSVTAHRLLGGIGGDVMGASQELARTAALLGIVIGLSA